MSERYGPRELWEIVDHWPLYVGVGNLARYLAIGELLRTTLSVPGDLAEFGVWRGSTSMLLTKILKIVDPQGPKVVHSFDAFQGLTEFAPQDGDATAQAGRYKGSLEEYQDLIELYQFQDDIEIHEGLIEQTVPAFVAERPEIMFSFVYCDTDLYESTAVVLEHIAPRVMPGGLIVFDEWNYSNFPGEGLAANEFLAAHREEFVVEAPPNTRQPSLALRRRA